ncbi:ectoine/hydroxyectoine ABC transporter permease subunit EhuD [Sporosarcina sp. ACRSM]|uniref:ectoine/hydroxyectoine ABC transporter permease subunit EhuD n=1 Tax=Sporosarcina sp. ACRSM TaxID=2918216 RepID=UPI001EF4E094|nr:ectoine/hydroxyectoine ABC transporter permease subunit EhuD [Sporosarcina sp. ACRSM]MCG7334522.1 ectoine/hydroxyectoine ABC transporter permease subunit EhuD [Sporosarcina sp. ACRSM]
MKWDWSVFFEVIPLIFKGLWITLGLTIACYLFAMIFGFFWVFMARIPSKTVRWIFRWIAEFIRSTPPLVQLFFIFYAWPMVPVVGVSLNPFAAAILGLGLHFSTYLSEVYRSGIESVDKGQWEASTALNLSSKQKWLKIILPQAIPPTIPMLGNYLIIMFKEVPLASTIGVVAMLHIANDYGAQYWKYVEPLTVVALFFLLLSYPSALLINKLEKKYNRRFDKKSVSTL